ncbi:hypothetical protein FACS189479_09270 [Spirochaetia bacterium]|nr:hypothetical protein FACS189479_09270 [Spirochaetia bacterium]
MTTKKKIIIAGVAAAAVMWVVCGSLFWGGARASFRGVGGYYGSFGNSTVGNSTVAVKDFEPLELVFVTATAKKSADVDVRDLLLKEAKKLGGHGIINVNIDTQRKGWFGEVTLTGSALAIKYTDSAGVPAADNSLGSLSQIRRGLGWGRW